MTILGEGEPSKRYQFRINTQFWAEFDSASEALAEYASSREAALVAIENGKFEIFDGDKQISLHQLKQAAKDA